MDRKLRILVMAPEQLLTRAGGLRTQVERTTNELEKLGHQVEFFCPWKIYDFQSYDICHIFSMNTPNYFKYLLVKGKIPVLFSSVMWREGSRKLIRLLVEAFIRSPYLILNDVITCRTMSEGATLVLPNTGQERQWLSEAIGVEKLKCHVVPNGADDHFRDQSRQQLREASSIVIDEDFVFCCSVVSTRKNLVRLAKVCKKNALTLVVAGPIVEAKLEEELLGIFGGTDKIRLLGKLDNDSVELGYLYSHCRVFCLPSFYETPGIAALEAGLCGANIVVTKIGGADDYFGDAARYIDPYSDNDIEVKLLDAWENGAPDDAIGLPDRIRSEFSWQAVARKTLSQYHIALEV